MGGFNPMYATDFRPDSLDEIVGIDADMIESMLNGPETPNFLFHGEPGTGKTTTARAIANELTGGAGNMWEINASNDRGIETIRTKINRVARKDTGTQMTLSMGVPVILLDEADSMTPEAYQAIRSPMEDTAAVFILTANDLEPIHSAVRSRCMVMEFELTAEDILQRMHDIIEDSDMDVPDRKLSDIAGESNGDMRLALNKLEQYVRFEQPSSGGAVSSRIAETLEQEGL